MDARPMMLLSAAMSALFHTHLSRLGASEGFAKDFGWVAKTCHRWNSDTFVAPHFGCPNSASGEKAQEEQQRMDAPPQSSNVNFTICLCYFASRKAPVTNKL